MEQHYLNQALTLAQEWQGQCAPNPAVGALIVRDGKIIAKGAHKGCGELHAEAEAINLAGQECVGATLYLTLEPCCHWGKTPPCTDKIIQAGFKQVVYAYEDPNPAVAGKGIQSCRAAGIDCVYSPTVEIDAFYRPYHYWLRTGLPWVIAKLAVTMDGKIASVDGLPLALTGNKLNALTHQQRAYSDAIVTTAKTIARDDPLLNCRLPDKTLAKPLYIIDRLATCSSDARCLAAAESVTLFHTEQACPERCQRLRDANVHLICVPEQAQGCDLQAVFKQIGVDGRHQCWLEAGGRLFNSALDQGCIQRCLLFVSTQTLAQSGYDGFHQAIDFRQASHVQWHSLGEEAYCDIYWESATCLLD